MVSGVAVVEMRNEVQCSVLPYSSPAVVSAGVMLLWCCDVVAGQEGKKNSSQASLRSKFFLAVRSPFPVPQTPPTYFRALCNYLACTCTYVGT